jgi:hypothetical protein
MSRSGAFRAAFIYKSGLDRLATIGRPPVPRGGILWYIHLTRTPDLRVGKLIMRLPVRLP